MATARNGRACLIPLVPRLSFGTRLASGWIRRRPHEAMQPVNIKTMSDRLVASTEEAAKRQRLSPITNHFSPLTTFCISPASTGGEGLNHRR